MSLFPGSIRPLGADIDAIDVAINDAAGNQLTGFDASRPANVTVASVAQNATDVVLLAANPARRRFLIHNTAGQNLFVKLGSAATSTLFSFIIAPKTVYLGELNDYTGVIHGIWSGAGSGTALVTEITT